MKKSIFIVLMALFVPTTIILTSQTTTAKVREVVKISNKESVAKEISTILTHTLSLNETQTNDVFQLFETYIKNTNAISKYRGRKYLKKISGFNYNLLQDLDIVLNTNQYMKFINLNGGSKPSLKTLISRLNGGLLMSPSAKSVLTGLLMNNYQG